MQTIDVLIVGGGPTGMMLAGELALRGLDVRVVERRTTQDLSGRRAGGLHARTLEVLDQRGIVDQFLEHGQRHSSVNFHVPLDLGDLPSRHNYVLALPQVQTERLLANWIAKLGVSILRGRSVVGFDQDENGVTVCLDDAEQLRAAWLVGCDGGRSGIRKTAKISLAGWKASTGWLIADVRMAELPELGFRTDEFGRHAMALQSDGETVSVVLAGRDPLISQAPTLEELAASLLAIYGTDFGVHTPRWMSRFTDAAMQAVTYRKGRVLLAGDAAHTHPPMGGQGLNLGIQDAINLGWKLALVARGKADLTLLDSFQAERHPVAADVLRLTMAQARLQSPGDRQAVLSGFFADMLEMDEPRRHFAARISGLATRYDFGGDHPMVGRRMPDLDIDTSKGSARIYEFLREGTPLLLNFGTPTRFRVGFWSEHVTQINARTDGVCELPIIGLVPLPPAVLIRPDGYVAWVGDNEQTGLIDMFALWFGDTAPRKSSIPATESTR